MSGTWEDHESGGLSEDHMPLTDSRVGRMVKYMTDHGFSVDGQDYAELFAELGRAGLIVADPEDPRIVDRITSAVRSGTGLTNPRLAERGGAAVLAALAPDTRTAPDTCICPRFNDTGGYRIADLCCPVHGVGGTTPGDGYWEEDQ